MDGLPVQEENKVPYRSKNHGVMHACGHDAHTAIGLVAARILAAQRNRWAGAVKFMFQPAEEGPGGALPMIQDGLLENPRVDGAFALHMWNDLPVGTIGVRSGPVFAGVSEFTLTLRGRGGHGAAPHQTIDPVVTAAQVILALQTIVSRKVNPLKSAVITVGKVQGGTRFNIIPDTVTLQGTVRYFDRETQQVLAREIKKTAHHVARAAGVRAELEYHSLYPPTVNDAGMTEQVRLAALEVVGKNRVVEADQTMGAEDMSYVLQRVPGSYFLIGSANRHRGLTAPHHSARFDFDEEALLHGLGVTLRLAHRWLAPKKG
jgi:amidohydrolase